MGKSVMVDIIRARLEREKQRKANRATNCIDLAVDKLKKKYDHPTNIKK